MGKKLLATVLCLFRFVFRFSFLFVNCSLVCGRRRRRRRRRRCWLLTLRLMTEQGRLRREEQKALAQQRTQSECFTYDSPCGALQGITQHMFSSFAVDVLDFSFVRSSIGLGWADHRSADPTIGSFLGESEWYGSKMQTCGKRTHHVTIAILPCVGNRNYHQSRQLFCVPITPQLLARLHLVNECTIC